jgi:hypothetical protein
MAGHISKIMRDDKWARKRCPALYPEQMRYRIPGLTPGDLRPDSYVVPSGIRRAFFRAINIKLLRSREAADLRINQRPGSKGLRTFGNIATTKVMKRRALLLSYCAASEWRRRDLHPRPRTYQVM